jgi:anti-anti-sigma factor
VSNFPEVPDGNLFASCRESFEVLELPAGRFRLIGELDGLAVVAVADAFRDLGGDVEFECSKVTFIDSCGLHLLNSVREACAAGGGRLVVVNPQPCLVRLLELTGLGAVVATRVDDSWPR